MLGSSGGEIPSIHPRYVKLQRKTTFELPHLFLQQDIYIYICMYVYVYIYIYMFMYTCIATDP